MRAYFSNVNKFHFIAHKQTLIISTRYSHKYSHHRFAWRGRQVDIKYYLFLFIHFYIFHFLQKLKWNLHYDNIRKFFFYFIFYVRSFDCFRSKMYSWCLTISTILFVVWPWKISRLKYYSISSNNKFISVLFLVSNSSSWNNEITLQVKLFTE